MVEKQNVAIRGNSIFENQGRGIYFRFLFSQSVPQIETVESVEGEGTTISGSLEGEPEETYLVDLFGNVGCDKFQTGFEEFTFAGEGEDFLGSAEVEHQRPRPGRVRSRGAGCTDGDGADRDRHQGHRQLHLRILRLHAGAAAETETDATADSGRQPAGHANRRPRPASPHNR